MHSCCAFYYADRPTDRTHFWHFSPHLMCFFFFPIFRSFLKSQRIVINIFVRLSIRFQSDSAVNTLHTIYMTLSLSHIAICMFSDSFLFISLFVWFCGLVGEGFGMISQTNCHPKFILSILLCNIFFFFLVAVSVVVWRIEQRFIYHLLTNGKSEKKYKKKNHAKK